MTDPKKKKYGMKMTRINKDVPKAKPGRVHASGSDAVRQQRMEGKDTPFQQRLRKAESTGEGNFNWKGKEIAARKNPDIARPDKKVAVMGKMGLGSTPIKGPSKSIAAVVGRSGEKTKGKGGFGKLFKKDKSKTGGVSWKREAGSSPNRWGGNRRKRYKG